MKLLAYAGLALAVGVVAVGCGYAVSAPKPGAAPAPPSPAAPGPASADPAAPPPAGRPLNLDGALGAAGSDGLTVRYRDADGTIKKLGVQDFPR